MNIRAGKLFDGEQWLEEKVVTIQDGKVFSVTDVREFEAALTEQAEILIPGFIDAQVYGAGGRLFSQYPEAETLFLMEEIFLKEGTCLFQPTIATNSREVVSKGIRAFKDYKSQGGRRAFGLHLEGPWINETMKGAHLAEFIHAPTVEEVEELIEEGRGVITMITLAPECCDPSVLVMLTKAGIRISVGHSAIDMESALKLFRTGDYCVTHLFNAMSGIHHRSPGLAAAVFSMKPYCSIIPDGFHVHPEMISLATEVVGSKLFAITDAVTNTSEGPYRHEQAEGYYACNGTLSGSAISMFQAMNNLRSWGVVDERAIAMCSTAPAAALGLEHRFGKIKTGYEACFNIVSKGFGLIRTICS